MDRNLGPGFQQCLHNHEGWGFPHIVGARFKCKPPYRELATVQVCTKTGMHLLHQEMFLPLVDRFNLLEQREVYTALFSRTDHRPHVFGKTRAPVAYARKEKVVSDAAIKPDAPSHFGHIRSYFLTQVG